MWRFDSGQLASSDQKFVEGFRSIIQKRGPESVAFLSTGQMPTEEMLLLGCLAKFGMGWVHGDSNTRQCMATAAVAYKQALGFDAPPIRTRTLKSQTAWYLWGRTLAWRIRSCGSECCEIGAIPI
ncbi:MAG: hypothetical protein U0894_12740 [Pirellulales bacterium]